MAEGANPPNRRRVTWMEMTWMEMCLEDVGAHFGLTNVNPGGTESIQFALSWRMMVDLLLSYICFGTWVIAFWRGLWDGTVFYTEIVFEVKKITYNSLLHIVC